MRSNSLFDDSPRDILEKILIMLNTTLCYIEKDGCYLMMHRTKKENDINRDKWIGIGGKFEDGESPEECLIREVREETGLILKDWSYRAIITFTSDKYPTEYMHLFTSSEFVSEGDFLNPTDNPTGTSIGNSEDNPITDTAYAYILDGNLKENCNNCSDNIGDNRSENIDRSCGGDIDDKLSSIGDNSRNNIADNCSDNIGGNCSDNIDGNCCDNIGGNCSGSFPERNSQNILKDCDEGVLEWIPKNEMYTLPIWQGDKIFLRLIEDSSTPFFSLKLTYKGDRLVQAVKNGRESIKL